MKRVLVTGGRGFLGSHIVRALVSRGHDVRVFTHEARRDVFGDAPGESFEGDIRDPQAVREAMNGIDAVVHLVSNFRKGGSDTADAHDVNVGGTRNVLQAAREEGVQRVVHCSTIGVHGDVQEIPASEKTPFNPRDLYQETKLEAEQWAWAFHRETGLPLAVVRPISIYGPGDFRMLKLFKGIQKGWFPVAGGGKALFHPAYVDDVVAGFLLCLEHPAAPGEAFIVGGEGYLPLRDLFREIAEQLETRPPWLHVPLPLLDVAAAACEAVFVPLGLEPPLHRRRVSFYRNQRAFSIEKAKRVLGFAPRVGLSEGLTRTITWYRDNGYL